MERKYLIDTNVLIEAYQGRYPMDIFPSYWNVFARMFQMCTIQTIDAVKNEIVSLSTSNDDLSNWVVKNIPVSAILDEKESVESYRYIVNYVQNNEQYTQLAKDDFMRDGVADPWLIAFARSHGYTIVTNEIAAPASRSKVKIPDVCNACGVEYIRPIDMLRALQVSI